MSGLVVCWCGFMSFLCCITTTHDIDLQRFDPRPSSSLPFVRRLLVYFAVAVAVVVVVPFVAQTAKNPGTC